MLSLDLKDGSQENTHASGAVCGAVGDTKSHLYRSGTSLTRTRQWVKIPSGQFPCVLVVLGPHRDSYLGAWATTLSWTFAGFPYLGLHFHICAMSL